MPIKHERDEEVTLPTDTAVKKPKGDTKPKATAQKARNAWPKEHDDFVFTILSDGKGGRKTVSYGTVADALNKKFENANENTKPIKNRWFRNLKHRDLELSNDQKDYYNAAVRAYKSRDEMDFIMSTFNSTVGGGVSLSKATITKIYKENLKNGGMFDLNDCDVESPPKDDIRQVNKTNRSMTPMAVQEDY